MSTKTSSGHKPKDLSDAKKRLLEQRLRGAASDHPAVPAIPRQPAGTSQPLSPAQRGIWLIHQVEPDSAAYNLSSAYWVEGDIDLGLLQDCFHRLTQRHQILLTTFESAPAGVVQVRHPGKPSTIERVECADDEIVARARELVRQPFDLEMGPLLRLTLITGDTGRQLLLLSSHHVILDEWSLKILWREIGSTYEALALGREPELVSPPIQFADYAAWQHQRLAGDLADQQLDYWRRQLADPVAVAELPTDRARRANSSDRGGYVTDVVDTRTAAKLRELAGSENASLSMVLLLALQLLIQRYADIDDILIGTPIADRQQPETAGLLGYFLNTVVVRTDLSGDPTVRQALQRVRQTMLEVFEHRDIPFDHLVRQLNPIRPAAVHPFFQTMFVFQRQQDSPEALALPGAKLTPVAIDAASAKFDLTLFARDRGDDLETMFEYRRDLFESSTIERMLGHYRRLLESIAAAPDSHIRDLAILTAAEEADVLRDWQGHQLAALEHPLVVEAIAASVAQAPDSLAVIDTRDGSMTYGELQALAAKVAEGLRSAGVQPGEVVALHMERSPAAIAGLLGILRSGAAYLPVDPDYPTDRRQFMLRDARVRSAVTDPGSRSELESMGIDILEVPQPEAVSTPGTSSTPAIGAEDLAYVIYTSGSTGEPKGVLVSHGNLRASNAARLDYYSERPERYLLIPSLSFDSSIAGIFWALSTGGALVLPTQQQVRDPEALCELIASQRVTHLLCIPSLYRGLLEAGEVSRLESLQAAIVAGEPCPRSLVAQHRQLLPGVPLFNEYGPTEATVWATVHRCLAADEQSRPPIGKPVANTQVYVLDSQRRPVPPLVQGELAIGGMGVARGYLGRTDLTRERFVDVNLAGPDETHRLYLTGDIGRWRTDGNLEFLGRRDEQIKLSGFRIELGEIEAALCAHPGVEDAAAVLIPGTDASATPRLAAYYVPEASQPEPMSVATLRGFLHDRLPRFMVPTSLTPVDDLPRQPNGKLDREALASLEIPAQGVESSDAPTSRFEVQLTRIWLELLDDPSIDRQSNFFEHGGHSLLIPGLIERVRQDFGVELPLGAIFESPTVAELAAVIEADDGRSSWQSLVAIRSGGARTPLYVIHGLAGEISYFYNLARYLPRDRPVFGLQAPAEPFDEMVPMARDYLEEIRRAQPHGPYLLVGYCLGGCIAYEMACQLEEAGEEVGLLTLINSVPPSHLLGESAPLATILARRLKRFTSKGPRQMLASLTSVKGVKQHLRSGVRGDKETTDETLDDLLERMHPAYQEATVCHYRALRDYYPRPYAGDAWLFRGSDLYVGADYAWRQIIQGRLEVESITGHHQYVLKEPNVQGAAEKLSRILEALDR